MHNILEKRTEIDASVFHTACWEFLFLSVQQWEPWGGLQKSKLAFSSHVFLIKVLVFAFAFALSRGMLNAKGEILKNTLYFPFFRWKQGWVVGRLDKGCWMTELRDPAQLIIIAMGSCLLPLLLWLVPPSRGPVEPVKPRRGASEWAGKDGEGPQRLRSPLELPACRRNQYETENLHSSEWGFLCFKCVAYGPADLQKTGPVWFSQLQPWLLGLDLSPNLHWLCVWFCWRGFLPK